MTKRRRRNQTPAAQLQPSGRRAGEPGFTILVSLLAIAVALSGAAYAAATIGPGEIAKNAVRKQHIRNNEVSRTDLDRKAFSVRFGAGVLGGEVIGFSMPASLSGDDAAPPIGRSGSPEFAPVVAPRRVVISRLYANADAAPNRGVWMRLRSGGQYLSCLIPAGQRRCHNNKDRIVLDAGDQYDVFLGDDGQNTDQALPAHDYRFAYVVTPR